MNSKIIIICSKEEEKQIAEELKASNGNIDLEQLSKNHPDAEFRLNANEKHYLTLQNGVWKEGDKIITKNE